MKKLFNKIICVTTAVIAALGVSAATGCGKYYGARALSGENIFTEEKAVSNGGFAVEKGGYIYFINGVEGNTAAKSFGKTVKGAIYRISKTDFAAHNYSTVDCVVPLVAHAEDYNAGLFVYGDYIYYATPSTAKNSDGEVQNENLDLKRTKLDGTQTVKNPFVTIESLSAEYRFVEKDGTVYALYVAEDEKLYDEETGVKNLHSYNTQTKADTLLAYNVDSVLFDGADKTNPRVFYTMNVKNYSTGSNYGYNQLYTVTADKTEANEYDTSNILGWNDDEDEGEVDRYINCGDLVFDGIGAVNVPVGEAATPFNFDPTGATVNDSSYTYKLVKYCGGTLFYTRTTTYNSTYASLFSVKDSALTDKNPVTRNAGKDDWLLVDGSAADGYIYLFDDSKNLESVLIAEDAGGITLNKVKDGKLQTEISQSPNANYYNIVRKDAGTATLLFTDGDFVYYSLGGGNGKTIYRTNYTGNSLKYVEMPVDDVVGDYSSVRILDLDACDDWYMPELIQNQIMFASETESFTSFNYIMACDLRVYNAADKTYGDMMTNAQINAVNEKCKKISEIFTGYDAKETPSYANLINALQFVFYSGDTKTLKERAAECNERVEENADPVYFEQALAKVDEFMAPTAENDWKDYTDKKTVNGEEIYANRRDYYYAVVGKMTDEDAEAYGEALVKEFLKEPAEKEPSWYESLSKGAKAGFIIGMCAIGLMLIGGSVAAAVVIKHRKETAQPKEGGKRRIKVDTTDDKNIDVYADPDAPATTEASESEENK